jgi:hypothetical protein
MPDDRFGLEYYNKYRIGVRTFIYLEQFPYELNRCQTEKCPPGICAVKTIDSKHYL